MLNTLTVPITAHLCLIPPLLLSAITALIACAELKDIRTGRASPEGRWLCHAALLLSVPVVGWLPGLLFWTLGILLLHLLNVLFPGLVQLPPL